VIDLAAENRRYSAWVRAVEQTPEVQAIRAANRKRDEANAAFWRESAKRSPAGRPANAYGRMGINEAGQAGRR